jgi:hypothetical protein
MNRNVRILLIVVVVLLGATALIWTGYNFGRSVVMGTDGFYPGGIMGFSTQYTRSGRTDRNSMLDDNGRSDCYGMMGDYDMMGGHDMMESSAGYGRHGMMGGNSMMNGFGMMSGFGNFANVDPLSVEETRSAVEAYLDSYDDKDLAIEEIMIFDNNAYAIIIEESTGIGAFELLVNPATKVVFPEYGPNMMWNLKYGMMSGFGGFGMMGSGMMGGSDSMMGGFDFNENFTSSDELTISSEEALEIAQNYLDQYSPGTKVSDEITTFYGYYTIDIERDGKITGMVSVNGFTGQVFPHTWHGEFIEMSEG